MRALMRIAPERKTLTVTTSVRVTHRRPQMHPTRMAPNVRSMRLDGAMLARNGIDTVSVDGTGYPTSGDIETAAANANRKEARRVGAG